jgi:hypothetical protein
MALLSDVALDAWSLGPLTTKNGLSIAAIKGATPMQLLPRSRLGEITTPFNPSVYEGTGAETRKGILLTVPSDVGDKIVAIEAWAQKAVGEAKWSSALKGDNLKAKIVVSGSRACFAWDANDKPMELPTDWVDLPVLPVVDIKVWTKDGAAGLILEVIALMVGERRRSVTFV